LYKIGTFQQRIQIKLNCVNTVHNKIKMQDKVLKRDMDKDKHIDMYTDNPRIYRAYWYGYAHGQQYGYSQGQV
jgi:hypothetical protein